MNTGSGKIGNGHPALEDVRVRQAIAHAIDKDTLVERVLQGLGSPGQSMNVAVAPKWNLKIPDDKQMKFNLDQANQILDDAGLQEGLGRHPHDARRLEEAEASASSSRPTTTRTPATSQFIKEWLQDIGIKATRHAQERGRAHADREQGSVRPHHLVVDAVRGPDRDDVVPHVRPGARRSPTTVSTTTRSSATRSTTGLFNAQKIELDEAKRVDLVHQALQRFYDQAPYVVLYLQDTVEAYRNDRFEGFVRQPAETGPVIYTQSDPSYTLIKPISGSTGSSDSSGSGGSTAAPSSDSDGGGSSTGLDHRDRRRGRRRRRRRHLHRTAPPDRGRARVARRRR